MKNFLRVLKAEVSKGKGDKSIKSYCNRDYEKAQFSVGMMLIAKLLIEVNNAVQQQPFLTKDVQVLAEKAINKIDINAIKIQNGVSYQILNDEYFHYMHITGLWQMLLDHFVDFTLCVTEREFRDVAYLLMLHLKELSKQEKGFVTEFVGKNVNLRDDGRYEIIFSAEIWGDEEFSKKMVNNAEKAGICFVDISASPINKKAILPYGWRIQEQSDNEGYTSILDDLGRKRGEYRLTRLPNHSDNGEFDFFFDDSPTQIADVRNPKILLGTEQTRLISNS